MNNAAPAAPTDAAPRLCYPFALATCNRPQCTCREEKRAAPAADPAAHPSGLVVVWLNQHTLSRAGIFLDDLAREAVRAVWEAYARDGLACHRAMNRLRTPDALTNCAECAGLRSHRFDAKAAGHEAGGWEWEEETFNAWRDALNRAWADVSGLGKVRHWAKAAPLFASDGRRGGSGGRA